MTTLVEETLTVQDVPRLLVKYRRSIVAGALIGLAVFTTASFILPPKYKVKFILTIDPLYFQSPLVGEFIPGLGGSGDMKTQGESLMRQALTPEFLDSLGQKYEIYSFLKAGTASNSLYRRIRRRLKTELIRYGLMSQSVDSSYALALERQRLISHIEISNEGGTSYSVGYTSAEPDIAFHLSQDLYGQIIHSLLDMRTRNLVNVHDAIARRLGSLTGNLDVPAAAAPAPTSSEPQLLREQLQQVRDQIRALSAQFTDEHPVMQELHQKEAILTDRLHSSKEGQTALAPEEPQSPAAEGEASREVYSDLTRKLNYLKIAIDSDQARQADFFNLLQAPLYPESPVWPKKPLFAVWGLALGLFIALFSAALREYFDRSALLADTIAHHLQVPLLGSFPTFSWKPSKPTVPLISAPKP
jgi:hypothetical protein